MADRGTPEWWRDRLIEKYGRDIAERTLNAAYYDSINPAPDVTAKYRNAYQRLLAISKTPWGRLAVDIVAERLKVNGFRLGESDDTDDALWRDFTRNKLQAVQGQVHREALALGTSYISVWPNGERNRAVFESGMAVTHETMPGDPHEVAGAIKLWHDTIEGRLRCNVYLPDAVFRWRSQNEIEDAQWGGDTSGRYKQVTWEPLPDEAVVENPFERVSMVPFVVRPNWEGYGQSDLEDLRPIISRIESITANSLLAVELGAFRQRWATGLEIPTDPDTEQPVEPFKVALDRLWTSEDPDTKFGSFDSTDIRPYLQAVSDAIGQLSSVSRIPTLYFNQSELSNPPSAASLEATETGLIKKVIERQHRFSESWEEVVKLMLEEDTEVVTVSWDDPRTRSEAQMMDAAIKLREIGMPWQALMEYLGYSPTEIDRLVRLRSADTFSRLLESPLPNATRLETPTQQQGEEDEQ